MLRYFTAGETHGKCLTVIIEGAPAGFEISLDKINAALSKRQRGYGRGGRMQIERDSAEILSGVRGGITLGSPIAMMIKNRDWENWQAVMGTEASNGERVVEFPRPGHADLAGGMKYDHHDLRNVLERASARETAARVAAGALAQQLLEPYGVTFNSRVVSIGTVTDTADTSAAGFWVRAAASLVGFGDEAAEKAAMEYIDDIRSRGESCGGVVEIGRAHV